VSDTDELIGGALRDLAEQAVTVRPAADALWRAGQRRRRRNVMAISATAPGAAAVAAVLAFTLGGGGAPAGHGGSIGGASDATGRVVLSTPIQFEQVAQVSKPPCTAGAAGYSGRPQRCRQAPADGGRLPSDQLVARVRRPTTRAADRLRLALSGQSGCAKRTRPAAGTRSPRSRPGRP